MANPEHLAKLKEGVAAWNAWREENPSIRPDLMGANLSGAKLVEANLIGADLVVAELNDAHLYDADLRGAKLIGADLSGALLYGAKLIGANLSGANLTDANVADLAYLQPVRARLVDEQEGPQFEVADVRGQSRHGLLPRLWQWLRTNPIPYRKRMMRGRYRAIRGLSSSYGNRLFVRDAADQDYLDTIESQLHNRWGRFLFWCWGLTDYGRSLLSVIVFASIFMSVFGWGYSHWPGILSYGGRTPTPFTPYYFSIVTYTTLGFGDVKPNNLVGEILVSAEVILGYVTLGLLLAVLAEKVARRS